MRCVQEIIAQGIRSVDLDALPMADLARLLDKGDIADAEAKAVLRALYEAGYVVSNRPRDD